MPDPHSVRKLPVRSVFKKMPAAACRDGQSKGGERRRPSGLVTYAPSKCCADRTCLEEDGFALPMAHLSEPMEVEVGQPDGRRDNQQHDHFSRGAGSGDVALDCLERSLIGLAVALQVPEPGLHR